MDYFDNLDYFAIFIAEDILSFNKKRKFQMFYIEMPCKQSITYVSKKPVLSVDIYNIQSPARNPYFLI